MTPRRLPPLRSLEAFVRIARLGSAKSAAEELAISPSALSRRVSALEDFTGKKLFNRKHQAMVLTADGTDLFEAVAPALDELADRIWQNMGDSKIMRLRLGVMPLFGGQRLVPRLPELRRLYPALHIDIDSSSHPIPKLGDTLDAAITLSDEPDDKLHCVRLDHNKVHAIASRAVAEQMGPTPNPELLARQSYLLHSEMMKSFEAWRKATGLDARYDPTVDHYDSGPLLLEAAAQGLGIAIMHGDHISRSNDDRIATLFDLQVESPYSYWFVCKPRALESRPVRLFHDWLVGAQL
ncbi:LysR substrate-binding domain-containing protein [Croceicoccus naphthovorans]|uniref:LysR family transcriptional regulator n=1 Tax=Croceicoccus naphthovorans TaxID=1348774 RepID=A0A0G3XH98_9SPHN|nr:LysR substrate-binding domain-containing protein [Croceicoccus naphthovorans]AKM10522.1 LysR family transcriptional regulator [Croceicoccus naphthovorans]MBB3988714.1 DNA-binding transcriptional LysR family regulator [Croceicoccus naphthovorans]